MMNIIKNKKGSHVGMILSFGIFVTFLVFLYMAIEPALQTSEEQELLMSKLKPKVIERISSNFTTITVSNSSAGSCMEIDPYPYAGMNSTIALNPQGEVIATQISGDTLSIDTSSGSDFYKIHSADVQLDTQTFSPSGCTNSYKLGVNRKRTQVSKQKTLNFIEEYDYNYSNVKKSFNIPKANHFGVDFIYDNGTRAETNTTNLTRNIFIEKFSIQYFDEEAKEKGGFLRVRIW